MPRRKHSVRVHLSPRLGSKRVNKFQPLGDPPTNVKHRSRILRFQESWQSIREDLPPQFSRRHSEYLVQLFRTRTLRYNT